MRGFSAVRGQGRRRTWYALSPAPSGGQRAPERHTPPRARGRCRQLGAGGLRGGFAGGEESGRPPPRASPRRRTWCVPAAGFPVAAERHLPASAGRRQVRQLRKGGRHLRRVRRAPRPPSPTLVAQRRLLAQGARSFAAAAYGVGAGGAVGVLRKRAGDECAVLREAARGRQPWATTGPSPSSLRTGTSSRWSTPRRRWRRALRRWVRGERRLRVRRGAEAGAAGREGRPCARRAAGSRAAASPVAPRARSARSRAAPRESHEIGAAVGGTARPGGAAGRCAALCCAGVRRTGKRRGEWEWLCGRCLQCSRCPEVLMNEEFSHVGNNGSLSPCIGKETAGLRLGARLALLASAAERRWTQPSAPLVARSSSQHSCPGPAAAGRPSLRGAVPDSVGFFYGTARERATAGCPCVRCGALVLLLPQWLQESAGIGERGCRRVGISARSHTGLNWWKQLMKLRSGIECDFCYICPLPGCGNRKQSTSSWSL